MRPLRTEASLGKLAFALAFVVACGDSSDTAPDGSSGEQQALEIFENLRFEEVSDAGAMFRFTTTIETTCEAEFGLSRETLDRRAVDPNMDPNDPYGLLHEIPLGGLPASTEVFVRARAEDRDGTVYVSGILSFTTLASVDSEMVNVARITSGGSISDVSSNFGGSDNDGTWGANNAIDGNPSTEWSSFGDGDDAFIVIDLGAVQEVRELRFQSRKMTDGSSIIQSITITIDGETLLGPFDTPSPDQMYTVPFDPPLNTAIVRVDAVQTTGGNTGAKEIEIYAQSP